MPYSTLKSTINLKVSKNVSLEEASVPQLMNMTVAEALGLSLINFQKTGGQYDRG